MNDSGYRNEILTLQSLNVRLLSPEDFTEPIEVWQDGQTFGSFMFKCDINGDEYVSHLKLGLSEFILVWYFLTHRWIWCGVLK